ncbi:hypothetical protein Zmor_019078 [Zophobas morio]|jgi:hypothetical protein|uniref:Uncharacterized protein n=1 Tax=Zophobas morio TaxID=2755281 RepID=A0AA38HJA1_9CUCU|nr:hypothetical protein Zmor_019078 [Zophobas morio]
MEIPWYFQVKYREATIDSWLTWRPHVNYLAAKLKAATQVLYPLLHCKSKLSLYNKRSLYVLCISVDYGIYISCLGLRRIGDNLIASSATDQLLRLSTNARWFVRNEYTTTNYGLNC